MIFYCMVKDDGTNTLHFRTVYLLQGFFTLILIAIIEVILGILNIRFENFLYFILIMLPSPIIAYFFTKNRFNEDRGGKIVKNYSEQITSRKTVFALLAIGLFVSVFIVLILSGIFMSYLFSLHPSNGI